MEAGKAAEGLRGPPKAGRGGRRDEKAKEG